jgi:hypothetical protein
MSCGTKWLSTIEISTPPTQTTYTSGSVFSPTGMVVTAIYTDGTRAQITGSSGDSGSGELIVGPGTGAIIVDPGIVDPGTTTTTEGTGYAWAPAGPLTEDVTQVTILYTEGWVTRTAEQTITVSGGSSSGGSSSGGHAHGDD